MAFLISPRALTLSEISDLRCDRESYYVLCDSSVSETDATRLTFCYLLTAWRFGPRARIIRVLHNYF